LIILQTNLAMQSTAITLDQHRKCDTLLQGLLKEPEGKILLVEFNRCAPQVDPIEAIGYSEIMIRDGVLKLIHGPKGIEVKFTESGLEFYLSGGYSRNWKHWDESVAAVKRHSAVNSKILLALALILLLLTAGFLLAGKIKYS
jgi:hypothetical protein